jgi:hypothetical protein
LEHAWPEGQVTAMQDAWAQWPLMQPSPVWQGTSPQAAGRHCAARQISWARHLGQALQTPATQEELEPQSTSWLHGAAVCFPQVERAKSARIGKTTRVRGERCMG